MQPHWYSFRSRLGLLNPPLYATESNTGVEDGPTALLSPEFLQKFSLSVVDEYIFTAPEQVVGSYEAVIARDTAAAAELIRQTLKPGEVQVVLGGDHSAVLPGMQVILEQYEPKSMGYIQFDAHADLNSFATTTTGNFHGIYLRSIVDNCGSAAIDALIPQKLPFENLLYIGNLDLDPEEKRLFGLHAIRSVNLETVRHNSARVQEQLAQFVAQFQHIHISFDIDMLDESVAPATGIPCEAGFLVDDVVPLLEIIKKSGKQLSLDLVEVNPRKAGAAETIAVAQALVGSVLLP